MKVSSILCLYYSNPKIQATVKNNIIILDDTTNIKSFQLYENKIDMTDECDTYLKNISHKSATNIISLCSWNSSFLIPGSYLTKIKNNSSNKMFTQGICRLNTDEGSFILTGAYDRSKSINSVIYIEKIINNSPKYIKTIILPDKTHCGGLAFDGTNLWICSNNHYIKGIKYNSIKNELESNKKFIYIDYDFSSIDLGFNINYLTYSKNMLWAGQCNNNSPKMYGFTISNKNKACPILTKSQAMFVPDYTEGVAIHSDGTTFFTTSHTDSTKTGEKRYMSSKLIIYSPSWKSPKYNNELKLNVIARNNRINSYFLPPMSEEICLTSPSGTGIYITFESICKGNSDPLFKSDRVLRFKISKLLKN